MVSVIVPCYKQGEYLDDALQSLANQSFTNWECIIVNDGSPDNAEEVSLRWTARDSRFTYFYKENGGVSSARNLALQHIKGDYVQLLDGDDMLQPQKLEKQVNFLERNQDVDIVYSASAYFNTDNPATFYPFGKNGLNPTLVLDKKDQEQLYALLWCNLTTICSTLYRRAIFDTIKYFEEDMVTLEDWDFHISCCLNGFKFHFEKLEGCNSLIRIHGQSLMRNPEKMKQGLDAFVKKINRSISPEILEDYAKMGLPGFLTRDLGQAAEPRVTPFSERLKGIRNIFK